MIANRPGAHAIAATDRPGIGTGDGRPHDGSRDVAADLGMSR
ncbi:hypothetical protein SAMN05192583_1117 [Sphingomonas gellani]|uniref:Uncharacterized protein n=1 Tax=Sphingomonas gellani TaxID=1166340 RepID=A0A1H8AXZ6_9SPHN|nr:hypothetical protein SAMN05192583_1117 [Sphingomonas gellani]